VPPPPAPAIRLSTLLTLAWPIVLARSTQAVIGFCDALMTAPLGEEALAAATTGAVNSFTLVILPMGVVFIVQSFAAQLSGRGDLIGARRYGWYGLITAGATGLFALAAIPLVGPALGLTDYEPAVREMMASYLVIRLCAIGAVVGTEALGNWYGGLGNTRLQMIAGVVAMAFNIPLNWVLIYGHLGAPALGVDGAALASAIASYVGFAVVALAFLRGWGAPTATSRPLGLRLSELVRMLRFGLPNGLNWFLEFAAFALFINLVLAHLGTTVVAAMMVVLSINSIAFMPAFGVGSAGAILAGQAIGGGRHAEVGAVLRVTLSVTITWMVGIAVFYLVLPDELFSLFTPPGENAAALAEVGALLLALSAAWQLFDAIGLTLSEILRSAGDTTWTMVARLVLAWVVFTPAAIVGVIVLGGGAVIALLCVAGYVALLALVLAARFRSGRWKEIDLTGAAAAAGAGAGAELPAA